MKIYLSGPYVADLPKDIPMSAHEIIREVEQRLLREGFERWHLPACITEAGKHSRVVMQKGGGKVPAAWFDLRLYGGGVVRSPYMTKTPWGDPVQAATWDQWGVFIGALLDWADDNELLIRLDGYNPTAKHYTGDPVTSRDLFHWATGHAFAEELRRRGAVDLTQCRVHKWVYSAGAEHHWCIRCNRMRRFA